MHATLALLCLLVSTPTPAAPCLTIAATNDLHGAIEGHQIVSADGEGRVEAGGLLALSGYLDILRKTSKNPVLLLDGGDIYQGSMPSNLSYGRAMISAMNVLGYDASAIGNHEFDFGAEGGGAAQRNAKGAERLGVLKARIAEANFPFVAANILERDSDAQVAWPNTHPSVLKDVGGIRVGIIGASTPTTPEATRLQNVETLRFVDPAPRIVAEAKRLREAGAQLVVLTAHMGGDCSDLGHHASAKSCVRGGLFGELLAVLDAMPKNTIDVAIGGHTHRFMAHWHRGTAIIESGTRASHLGVVEACLRPGARGAPARGIDVVKSRIEVPHAICQTTWSDGTCASKKRATEVRPAKWRGHKVVPQQVLAEAMAPYLAAVEALERRPTGIFLSQPLSMDDIAGYLATALRERTASDFGMQNRGGVRDGLPRGRIAYGSVFEVLPFDNYVVQVKLSGTQLRAFVADMVNNYIPEKQPVWSNLIVGGPPQQLSITDGSHAPIVADKMYTLATNDFVSSGGDSHASVLLTLPPSNMVHSDATMREVIVPYLTRLYPDTALAAESASAPHKDAAATPAQPTDRAQAPAAN